MKEITNDFVNERIKEIYYSGSYSDSIFSVFIDLENGTRFRLSGYGASYTDANINFNDLYPINVNKNLMPREMFIGKKIREIVPSEQEWTYMILENDLQIGAFNDIFDKSLKIGRYTWKPNDEFFAQKISAPKIENTALDYEQFISFFKKYRLDRNLEAFQFFNVLNPKDKIPILENLVSNKDNRYSVYSILCYSYAETGEEKKAYDLLNYMYDNMSNSFADSTIISIRDRVGQISPQNPTSIIEQYKEVESVEKELEVNFETELLIGLIKRFLENKH